MSEPEKELSHKEWQYMAKSILSGFLKKYNMLDKVSDAFVEELAAVIYRSFQSGYLCGAEDALAGQVVISYDQKGRPVFRGAHELTEMN